MVSRSLPRWLLARRDGGAVMFIGLFMAVALVLRLALLVNVAWSFDWNWTLPAAFTRAGHMLVTGLMCWLLFLGCRRMLGVEMNKN